MALMILWVSLMEECDCMNFNDFKFDDGLVIDGLTEELTAFYVLECFRKSKKSVLVVMGSLYDANKFYQVINAYTNEAYLFLMDDFFTAASLSVSPELKLKRLETLEKINEGPVIVITNLMGYLKLLPPKGVQDTLKVKLTKNMQISRDSLVAKFDMMGYERDSMVTSTGEYAVRGFVLDIFLTQEDNPIRIEFFGDVIESIRYFDPETQRTTAEIESISCLPITLAQTDEYNSLLDYMPEAKTIYFDYSQINAMYEKLLVESRAYDEEQGNGYQKHFYSFDEIKPAEKIYINTIDTDNSKNVVHYHTSEITNFKGDYDLLQKFVNTQLIKNNTIVFVLKTKRQIEDIKHLFPTANVVHDKVLKNVAVNIIEGDLFKGFKWNSYIYISPYDVEEVKKEIKYKNNLHIGQRVRALDALEIGDYVVHRAHGIGIYAGVVTLKVQGLKKDFLQISYFGNDKVYIPVEKISSIYKYSDKDGMKPQINKLGSTNWERKKREVQKKIKDISGELIKLYAKRNSVKGEAYKDYPEEDIFGSQFVYTLTRDQARAINDINHDLDSVIPMDRLLCGDVGFGKTEVAFRGMFKTVCNNKQVMYLCPTTILSKQQYASALERFKEYPVEIRLFNRFTTKKEADKIIEEFKNGKIDILFGTHRLLSDEIKPKSLGLLVIDEEQRFGVTHKEKIKKLKADVNVLTLSATPIPRTLKMSLSGLRDLSIIDTPPINRSPIQTYVIKESDVIVKDAIYKELSRNGQVFVLYNRVDTIDDMMHHLSKIVPEARIRFAHGRMTKTELDDIMDSFINHDFDILVSTTIIETGIDIPNANTLIIYDADRFGLSQLYQLRGRVGRSERIAYAYLLYDQGKMLNDVAVKRLQAIRDFTELGSGYKIAMRDLSIRGAGDLLGSEQAGFVDTVGISLYMKMIEEEMKKLKGEEVIEDEAHDALLKVETHIDDNYVSDESVKIEIHKLINEIDSYDKLVSIKEQLKDRFGDITPEMEIYMYEEWFEKLAIKLNITKVYQSDRMIKITLPESISNKIKGDKLFLEAYNINPNFTLQYVNKEINISLNIVNQKKHFIYDVVKLMELITSDVIV